ncbi:hypothetical protein FJR48_10830 [Sulfurimonas lithotrophica]|uniref:Beta-ketoacyl synthase N-terminal domain-containing protein n=1 Tax=Sulfurimonas lithotrophica TaxID=2590022 RepID=A0A5P8P3M0_9BACT|nr:hypothetical protein [Sulfurimonas lithotrophica]QFR50197.1 hypothetical protein FJR48_10830 [Sulfurimonas lithotrophica]
MKLYINAISSYRSDLEDIDVKKELKQKYKHDPRRQDSFIHLGVLGAYRLKDKYSINTLDELYVTTGIGNVNVLEKIYQYVIKDGNSIKPYDFLNMLGNTTSYYIAKALGTKGKALFQISDNFTYINTLMSAFSSIKLSGNNAIISSCDLVTESDRVIKRVLGVDETTKVVSSVNYQRVSLEKKDAFAELELENKTYTLDEIKTIIQESKLKTIASPRCKELNLKCSDVFFETIASSTINEYIEKNQNMIFCDCIGEKYKIIKLRILN